MNNGRVWNDESRDELLKTLRRYICGELRLTKRGRGEILEACRDVYISDVCPEPERDTFVQLATDEFPRVAKQLDSEKATWPEETDCDRLDRVEAALRARSILLWQVSPCCDTCTGGEVRHRIDRMNRRYPGFRDRVRGYAFFIDQNMPGMLADGPHLSVYLGFGWLPPGKSQIAAEVYESNALGIAREVCQCLSNEGLETDWDGSLARKIGISINWQRRTSIE
jgi:hypothetical protein